MFFLKIVMIATSLSRWMSAALRFSPTRKLIQTAGKRGSLTVLGVAQNHSHIGAKRLGSRKASLLLPSLVIKSLLQGNERKVQDAIIGLRLEDSGATQST